MKSYYSLAAVVDQWLIENDLKNNMFPKGLAWAIRGLRELEFDSWPTVKTVLLDVTDRKTVVLPGDFVAWCKVAIKYGQYALALGENTDLSTLDRAANENFMRGLPKYALPNGVDFANYSYLPYANYQGMTLNVANTGFLTKGSFKEYRSEACTELLLDYDYGYTQVYLEYISDGFDPCGETIIHPYTYDYLFKYIDARYENKNNPDATEASRYRLNREVEDARRVVRARGNGVSPTDLENIVREFTTLALKM
jgi:hypothetical protein